MSQIVVRALTYKVPDFFRMMNSIGGLSYWERV
jgi:hypothetical protein